MTRIVEALGRNKKYFSNHASDTSKAPSTPGSQLTACCCYTHTPGKGRQPSCVQSAWRSSSALSAWPSLQQHSRTFITVGLSKCIYLISSLVIHVISYQLWWYTAKKKKFLKGNTEAADYVKMPRSAIFKHGYYKGKKKCTD